MKKGYTDDELNQLEILTDELVIWMFSNPNNRHPILQKLKQAFELGKLSR